MARFCGKCGAKLNENGLCQNCDSAKMASENKRQIKVADEQRVITNEKSNSCKCNKTTNDNKIDNYERNNRYSRKITRKEKKVKEKVDKATTKVKRKANKKASKIVLKADKKVAKEAKKASRTVGQKIVVFLIKLLTIIFALIITFSAISGVLVYFDIVNIPVISNVMDFLGINYDDDGDLLDENTLSVVKETNNIESTQERYETAMPDADKYFKNNSKIISEIKVNDSNKVTTEGKIFEVLNDLGFNDYPITTEYSMDGEYYEAIEISASSSTKHPLYQTYYINTNGDIWTIYFINDVVLANPVTYNFQSKRPAQLVVSESDSVTSYDSTTNKFYETIPNESELIVKKVRKINAETLNELTIEEIDKL